MSAVTSDAATTWRWSVVAVLALHLLSTAGTWWITDHGEILAVASNFLSSARFDLRNLDPAWSEFSTIAGARTSPDTRFLPLSILSLAPFLGIDHALGWRSPSDLRFVHLQGHFFVGLALLMAGRFIFRATRSGSTAAICVLLAGLNWPVWMIARRIGPEPVLLALMTALVTLGPKARFASLFLLPWVHASAPLLGLGACLWLAVENGSWHNRPVRLAGLGLLLGSLSVILLWNLPIHGDAFLGGYEKHRADPFFTLRNPLIGTATLVAQVLVFTLPLAYLTWRGGRAARWNVVALALPATAFFGAFSSPEPERRLAPLLVGWAVFVTARMPPATPRLALLLTLVSLGSGVVGLARDFVAFIETPLGTFSGPHLLILRLAFEEGHPLPAGIAAGLLLFAGFLGLSRTLALIAPGTVGSNAPLRPESRS